MNAYTYLTFLIIGLIVLAHLGLLYLVIRFAVTHAINVTQVKQMQAYRDMVSRLHEGE